MADTCERDIILQLTLDAVYNVTGIKHVREHKFHEERKWRFDVAWPEVKVALEIEGGAWRYGRHNRASTFLKDMEKYNEAASMGWLVLRCPWEWVEDGRIFGTIVRTLRQRGERDGVLGGNI